jgi:hypothetical protein
VPPCCALLQYHAILGLSGSLGSPSEKEFLTRTYGADFFDVPPFIDTCVGASKHPPQLLDNAISIYASTAEQYAAVADMALRKCESVPVVIIAKNSIAATVIHGVILERARAQLRLANAEAAAAVVQLFVETTEGQRAVVDRATTPFERGPYDVIWRVTVTEYWGGRGHDYRVKGRDVDAAGGLLVIATEIPVSEREWVQWKGRTARSDHTGQYAVVLCAADEPCKSSLEKLAENRVLAPVAVTGDAPSIAPPPSTTYRPALITALLQVRKWRAELASGGLAPRRTCYEHVSRDPSFPRLSSLSEYCRCAMKNNVRSFKALDQPSAVACSLPNSAISSMRITLIRVVHGLRMLPSVSFETFCQTSARRRHWLP